MVGEVMAKNILLILSFVFVSITSTYADDTATQANGIEVRKSIEYQTALKAFRANDFQKSFKLFGDLDTQYSGDEYVDFYYGRSAFELKKYEFAYSAFDRVLITNDKNHRARLELARTLFLMKAYKQAKAEFEKVLLAPIPSTVRVQINKFIDAIEEKQSGYILNKIAIFGFGWSDNTENTANDYLYNNQLQSKSKRKDTNFRAIAVLNLITPFKKNNNITSESIAVLFLQKQKSIKSSDLFVASLSSGIGYTDKNYKHLASLTYDSIWVGNKRSMNFYGVSYNLKRKIKKTNLFSLDFKIKKKNMVQSVDRAKDSRIYELGLSYAMALKKDKVTLSTNLTQEKKDSGTRPDVSKITNKYKISYDKKLFEKYTTVLDYQYQQDKYKDMYGFSNIPLSKHRKDTTHTITLKVSRKIDKKRTIGLELSHIKNDSNHDAYAYNKQNVLVNYTILF